MKIAGFPEIHQSLTGPYLDPTMEWYFNAPATTDDHGNILEPAQTALTELEAMCPKPWPDVVRENADLLTRGAGLWPGLDFQVIPYKGRPRTIDQNAANAHRHGAQGVEKFFIAKSLAGMVQTDTGEQLHVLTGPGDLRFKTTDLVAGQIGELIPLEDQQLEAHGFVHGTVNPIGVVDRVGQAHYLFDQDFASRVTRNPDHHVYISSGDLGWSIAVDIRKLITGSSGMSPRLYVSDICERGPEQSRVFARRNATIISGDSAQVGARYFGILEGLVRSGLIEAGSFMGDGSMPDLDMLSRSGMAGTGALAHHGAQVIRYAIGAIKELPQSRKERLVAFASNAANLSSVGGPIQAGIAERRDLQIVTVNDALEQYFEAKEPGRAIVLGLPEVIEQYPNNFGGTAIIKGKGKIADWMQIARFGTPEDLDFAAEDLKKLVSRLCKQEMAIAQGLEGHEIGDFMKDESVTVAGSVILAGTELWDILNAAGWQDGITELENVALIDPIKLLMQYVASKTIRS